MKQLLGVSTGTLQRIAFSLVCGVAIGTAMAGGATTEGWKYGRANCGPFAKPPIYNLPDCTKCCLTMIESNTQKNADCNAYCATVSWNLFLS